MQCLCAFQSLVNIIFFIFFYRILYWLLSSESCEYNIRPCWAQGPRHEGHGDCRALDGPGHWRAVLVPARVLLPRGLHHSHFHPGVHPYSNKSKLNCEKVRILVVHRNNWGNIITRAVDIAMDIFVRMCSFFMLIKFLRKKKTVAYWPWTLF